MIFDALKKFKKALKRYQLDSGKTLEDELLTAILLLIAVQCLNKRQADTLFSGATVNPVKQTQSDLDLFSQCQELYGLVSKFCPVDIETSLPTPLLNSIIVARTILGEDLLTALANDLSSIGFVYQIFNMTERQLALAAVQTANKVISKDQLIAFTQLYTPGWVVDFLLANTVFPVLKGRTNTRGNERFSQWLLEPQATGESSLKVQDLKIMDPACGSGHFLLAAFDLLLELYVSDGINKKEAIRLILLHSLYGADIDDKALWITSLALLTKCLLLGSPVPDFRFVNLCCSNLSSSHCSESKSSNDVLGSLSRQWLGETSHPLGRSYEVIVTNPPYIGRKLLSRELKLALQKHYPHSHIDLCAAFITRSLEMLAPNGRLGVITQASLLTLPSYKEMRNYLDTDYRVSAVVNCGTRVFPLATGEKIDSLLLIAHPTKELTKLNDRGSALHASAPKHMHTTVLKENPGATANQPNRSTYLSLKSVNDKAEQLKQLIINIRLNESIDSTPNSMHLNSRFRRFSDDYIPTALKQIILDSPKLATIADVRQGLATTDNKRFVRYYWDVDAKDLGTLWVPYSKGAGSERWYIENNFVVRWGKDGAEIKQAVSDAYPYLKGKTGWVVKNEDFYFRRGLCFSFINKKRLAVRRLPAGCIFDVASSAIFPEVENEHFLLAYLNSSIISSISNTINPTINLQVGDIKRLPLFDLSKHTQAQLSQLANSCYETKSSIVGIQSLRNQRGSDGYSAANFDLEASFNHIASKLQVLETQLVNFEHEIDAVMFAEISRLAKLDTKAINELRNWVTEQSNDNKSSSSYGLTSPEFAARLLASRIGELLSNGQEEEILIYPIIDKVSFPTLLGLDAGSLTWLEGVLQKRLASYFNKSSVLELGKTVRTSCRYFSVWLANSNCLLFASSRAFRNTMTALDDTNQSAWNKSKDIFFSASSIYNRNNSQKERVDTHTHFSSALAESEALLRHASSILSHQTDWTTKDLIKATNQSLILIGSAT
jgi:N-6 DNA Methylase